MSRRIVVATRKSALALAQCRAWIATLVQLHPGLDVEELHVTTTGDRITDRPLAEIGGKGLFLKEIEEALVDGRADLAVHSMKDVPPAIDASLTLSCIPEREDPRDVLITRDGVGLLALPQGAKIGTSSLRRSVQLQVLRPGVEVVPLRGNVGTRIQKCRDGQVDAVVLARAGLNRLHLEAEVTETLSPDQVLPAVGQGALAIEQRADDDALRELLAPLQHAETAVAVAAERGVMAAVEGDCKTPVAAFGQRAGEDLWLRALLAAPDGSRLRRAETRVPWPASAEESARIGQELGARLRAGG
jgi:hydroxymethylbilane synthase